MALGQTGPLVVEATEGSYALPNGSRIEALGVCDIGESDVRCWDRSGASLPDLAARLKAFYVQFDTQELRFRPGRTRRYVVFRESLKGNERLQADGPGYEPVNDLWDEEGRAVLWGRVTPERDAKTFDARITVGDFRTLPPVEAAFAPGQALVGEGYRFVFGRAALAPPPAGGFFPFVANPEIPVSKRWRVALAAPFPKPAAVRIEFEALDKAGDPIRHVSDKGLPISEREYTASLSHRNHVNVPSGPSLKGYARANFAPDPEGPLFTNIDPAVIGKIRATAHQSLEIWFRNLPVDPR